jgi:hypothetical protein
VIEGFGGCCHGYAAGRRGKEKNGINTATEVPLTPQHQKNTGVSPKGVISFESCHSGKL